MTIFLETDDYAKQFLEMADRDSFSRLPPQPAVPDTSSNEYAVYADAAGIEFSQDKMPPSKSKYTEAQLGMMPEWKAMSKQMYRVMEGYEFIGSDKQASDYGMDLINEFNWNVFGPAGIPGESGISSPGMMGQLWKVVNSEGYEDLEGNMVTRADVADQFMSMMDLYAETKTNGDTIKRAFRGLFGAPETYASLGGGIAAPFIKGAAMKTANVTARKMLMATAKASGFSAKYGAANPGKGGMIAGGAYAGMYAAANEAVASVSSAPRSLRDSVINTVTQTLAGVLLGGAAGKGIEKGAEVLSPVIKNKLQEMGVAADERIAEKGPLTGRLMSGFDPTDVTDPALSAIGKAAGIVDQAAPIEQATAMSGTASAADIVAPEVGGQPLPVGLLAASDTPTVSGLAPEYRVTVDNFVPEGTGKQSLVPIKLTPKNAEKVKPVMSAIAEEFPDPLASPGTYANMMAKMQNKAEVSKPPSWMIEHANDTEKWAEWFSQITPDQIKAADEGLAVQDKFKSAYAAGAGEELTGQLMLWTILSRMLSAFPHEGGYLELAEAATPFIKKAARGEWSDADSAAWREMSMTIQPEGAPGKSATSNANDFGEVFLKKMSAVDENGVSALTRLHKMIADPNMSSAQIRREYYSLAEGSGIANKILSFALLVSGRNDVVVLDRIQINQMWGGGEKIYDDIMKQFEGAQGLVQYEALERSLLNRVPDLYQRVGRGDVGSVGRYHWESWVRSSGQIVAHPTLEAVVGMGTKRPGANLSPTDFVPVKEGRFHTKYSGVAYEKLPEGKSRFIYNTSTGEPYQFTKQQLDDMFGEAFKKASGVLPPDFPGVKSFEGGNIPWYEYKGVDRGRLDELIREKGKPAKQY